MASPLKNKLLQGAELAIEGPLTPKNRQDYMRVWTTGMEILLAKDKNSIMATVRKSKDPVKDCAIACVNLVAAIRVESQGTMPIQAMAPAAYTLMLNALDFAERLGVVKVDVATLQRATHIYTNHIFKVLGVTPAMLTKAAGGVNGVIDSPGKLEMVRRRAGVVRDPRASWPVDVSSLPRNRSERRQQERRR